MNLLFSVLLVSSVENYVSEFSRLYVLMVLLNIKVRLQDFSDLAERLDCVLNPCTAKLNEHDMREYTDRRT
jgi:hypothetical protein